MTPLTWYPQISRYPGVRLSLPSALGQRRLSSLGSRWLALGLEGTFLQDSSSFCTQYWPDSPLHFSLPGNSFILPMACPGSKESSLTGHFSLEDTHLTIISSTFFEVLEGVRRHRVAVFSGEERKPLGNLWADRFLHFEQLPEDAANGPDVDGFVVTLLQQDDFRSSIPSCSDPECQLREWTIALSPFFELNGRKLLVLWGQRGPDSILPFQLFPPFLFLAIFLFWRHWFLLFDEWFWCGKCALFFLVLWSICWAKRGGFDLVLLVLLLIFRGFWVACWVILFRHLVLNDPC